VRQILLISHLLRDGRHGHLITWLDFIVHIFGCRRCHSSRARSSIFHKSDTKMTLGFASLRTSLPDLMSSSDAGVLEDVQDHPKVKAMLVNLFIEQIVALSHEYPGLLFLGVRGEIDFVRHVR
jgi:hypothetical protein